MLMSKMERSREGGYKGNGHGVYKESDEGRHAHGTISSMAV